jgi:hypothetical protein
VSYGWVKRKKKGFSPDVWGESDTALLSERLHRALNDTKLAQKMAQTVQDQNP